MRTVRPATSKPLELRRNAKKDQRTLLQHRSAMNSARFGCRLLTKLRNSAWASQHKATDTPLPILYCITHCGPPRLARNDTARLRAQASDGSSAVACLLIRFAAWLTSAKMCSSIASDTTALTGTCLDILFALHNIPAWNKQHEAGNIQSAACNIQSAACNVQSAACNIQSAACSISHAGLNRLVARTEQPAEPNEWIFVPKTHFTLACRTRQHKRRRRLRSRTLMLTHGKERRLRKR
jgi:hypothetical protein